MIRANQGHSNPDDVELKAAEPPKYLYYGTVETDVDSIEEKGITPKSGLYIHLHQDRETAIEVSSRHGKPVAYRVWARRMQRNGYVFFKAFNNVWLTKAVPTQYFKRDSFDPDQIQIIKKHILDVIKSSNEANDADDDADEADEVIEETVIPLYGWEYVQQALFAILLDDSCDKEICSMVAVVIWGAVLDGRKIKKRTTVALLYHRLGNVNSPYENELIWSITTELFKLDFVNSCYNPLKDQRIIKKLNSYGVA